MTDTEASVSWLRPHGGAGTWVHTPKHRPVVTDLAVTFLASLILICLFVGLVVVGRAAMCAMNTDSEGRPTLSYCDGWQGSQTVGDQP